MEPMRPPLDLPLYPHHQRSKQETEHLSRCLVQKDAAIMEAGDKVIAMETQVELIEEEYVRLVKTLDMNDRTCDAKQCKIEQLQAELAATLAQVRLKLTCIKLPVCLLSFVQIQAQSHQVDFQLERKDKERAQGEMQDLKDNLGAQINKLVTTIAERDTEIEQLKQQQLTQAEVNIQIGCVYCSANQHFTMIFLPWIFGYFHAAAISISK